MKVICSWCQREGRRELVREKAPFADGRETHSICAFHVQQMSAGRDPLISCSEEPTLPHHEAVLRRAHSSAVASQA